MDVLSKLEILTDAAKYDAACTSSGSRRGFRQGFIGNTSSSIAGCCHTFSADGRCVTLLKVLMSNCCIYDCAYCVNRRSNDTRRAAFTPEELAEIVTRSAGILDCRIVPEGAYEIARRSRGTPRIANRMLRRVRDFADVKADGVITREVADEALCALEIDYLGLDSIDRRMMSAIIDNYNGGPVGLETLAATIGEESVTLEDVYEPYLMQLGFLTRTPRGRCVTARAYQHLHKPVPGGAESGSLMEQLSL